ncbi:BPTD_3080 family restriction endonuclease [Pelagibius sp.]|uniref:BPTD_3080 family restriction endonuclease n=1 Tax=Pelagibius sp. TaxID=1931238 RepID=UPI003B50AB32
MTETFYEQPILNSPYAEPTRHHALDEEGQPTDNPPVSGRRRSERISPVPRSRKQRARSDRNQKTLDLNADDGISTEEQEYGRPIINEIRSRVAAWRRLPSQTDWGVTPATARLLQHWRHHDFQGVRPFFCQVEAVETIIWLAEVARNQRAHKRFWNHIQGANQQANPELIRLAMKMATGAGKTTVMAMLMAWQTVNAVRSPTSKLFTRGFLIVTPGITIRDRLRVLQPNDPDSYYKTRELVPADMLEDINKAKIVITNYHAFQLRELMNTNKVGKSLLQGRGDALKTQETEGQMVRRVAEELMGLKNIVVINDEAHHCYREKPGNEDLAGLKGDEKKEAEAENKAARLWVNGIEAFKRKLGVRAVYDLSATPFFLSGSGWAEGTLFPWTVSDFSLIDAIECGIVKLPRVPVADNIPGADVPIFRDLWQHIGKDMPKKGKLTGDPLAIPDKLKTALYALYKHYEETFEKWERAGIETPPVFIVVCNNTSTSKLVYEWISGWQRPNEDGEDVFEHNGHLKLFRNFDEHGNRFPRPSTLLIDSHQIESGGTIDKAFRDMAALEIEQFKREKIQRSGAGDNGEISDAELLREVMNTVGKKDRLGEQVRCVVSVSMLAEGWDANTVTHILGIRAFGTQLLCEQVVGRALRRLNYDPVDPSLPPSEWKFDTEYADIMGIPFDFTAKPQVAPVKPPKKTTRVQAVKERATLEIVFPRVTGYRVDLPEERLRANFTEDSKFVLTPEMVGPGQTLMEGIVGEGVMISAAEAQAKRPSTIAFDLAKHLLYKYFKDEDGEPKLHLFGQVKRIARQWIDEGYLICKGDTGKWMLEYLDIANQASERIYNAIVNSIGDKQKVKAVLDPYNPKSSTTHVGFSTTKDLWTTAPNKCHINYVALDSDWEAEFARVAEQHPRVICYVKNQGLGLEVPYKDGSTARTYIPDFIVRVDDGQGADDPLHLVVEVKGYRRENVKLKSETMRTQWVPGVNNLGVYGRWAFEEFNDIYEIDREFKALIDRVVDEHDESALNEAGAA